MKTTQWIQSVVATGDLCERYTDAVANAHSKLALMRLALSGGAAGYLCEMQSQNMGLDSAIIAEEFAAYINGKYIGEYGNSEARYSSCLYCQWQDLDNSLLLASTLTTFIDCKASIVLPENSFMSVYCDSESHLQIYCSPTAHCDVHYWQGATVNVSGTVNNIRLIAH